MILPENKKRVLLAVKKAQGILGKITDMVEADTYCLDVVQQVNAVAGLMRGARGALIRNHLQSCGTDKLTCHTAPQDKDAFIEELVRVIDAGS